MHGQTGEHVIVVDLEVRNQAEAPSSRAPETRVDAARTHGRSPRLVPARSSGQITTALQVPPHRVFRACTTYVTDADTREPSTCLCQWTLVATTIRRSEANDKQMLHTVRDIACPPIAPNDPSPFSSLSTGRFRLQRQQKGGATGVDRCRGRENQRQLL